MAYNYNLVKDFIEIGSNSGCKLKSLEYTNCKQKLEIECKCGDVFITTFDSFLSKNKRQCNECTFKKYRLSKEQIQEYCNKYAIGYMVIDTCVKNQKTYVKLKCPNAEHKPYWTYINKLKIGQRCKLCYHKIRTNNPLKWNKENIINLLKQYELEIIDDNYDFKNVKKKIKCVNKEGFIVQAYIPTLYIGNIPSPFMKNEYAYLNLRILCKKYNLSLLDNQKWKNIKYKYLAKTSEGYIVLVNTETLLKGSIPRIFHKTNPYSIYNLKLYCSLYRPDYIIISNKFNNKQDKLLFKYIGNKIDLNDKQRYFYMNLIGFIYYKQEHPKLSQSKGEKYIESLLYQNNFIFERQYKFDDLKNIIFLRFDFAIFEDEEKMKLKCLVEYDGIQHFKPVKFGNISYKKAEENFERTKTHDKIKNNYCNKNNIHLLRIPYWEFNNIDNILTEYLFN